MTTTLITIVSLCSSLAMSSTGDFFCVSLTSGLVQLRYNLGSGTNVLQSTNRVDTSGGTWHTVPCQIKSHFNLSHAPNTTGVGSYIEMLTLKNIYILPLFKLVKNKFLFSMTA